MNINEFASEVHANAISHGWWDEQRPVEEIIALIHSEWSEALEEARAGRPLAYQIQNQGTAQEQIQTNADEWIPTRKLEGIAVELIDGCIRAFDYIGKCETQFKTTAAALEYLVCTTPEKAYNIPLPRLIANLHLKTSQAYTMLRQQYSDPEFIKRGFALLYEIIGIVCAWLAEQGMDAERLMLAKHEYNKSRPYKHGKKF